MDVTARALWLPKGGNRSEEYEDAYWPARVVHRAGSRFRFAVADGATETSFAGLWARRLVRAYGSGCLVGDDWLACLRRHQAEWLAEVTSRPLPWYAEEKVRSGAYAALLGLELRDGGFGAADGDRSIQPTVKDPEHPTGQGDAAGGTWQALAVGDCCLVQWRGDELVAAFPAQSRDFFTSRPYLLSSNMGRNGALAEQVQLAAGAWQPGDSFALLSDALAAWVLGRVEAGEPPWATLAGWQRDGQQRRFARWIDRLRAAGDLRNDDVTLVLVSVA